MYNYLPTNCEPDKPDTLYVANKINQRSKITNNFMSELLNKLFNTRDFPRLPINSIYDFPRLKRKEMCRKIFLGSFQFKQCKSYVSDLLKNSTCYVPTQKYLKTIENQEFKSGLTDSKVIGVEISSRHKRGQNKTYKVFILYTPNLNKSRSVKGKSFIPIYFNTVK